MSKKTILLGFLLLFTLGYAHAQPPCTGLSKEELRIFSEGLKAYKNRELAKSKCTWEGIKTPCFELSYLLGRTNWYLNNYEQAKKYMEDALLQNANGNDTLYYDLAQVLKTLGQYDNAKKTFEDFLSRYPVTDPNDYYLKQTRYELAGIEYAKVEMETNKDCPGWRVTRDAGMKTINQTVYDEGFPAIFAVEADSFLIFTAESPQNRGYKPKKKPKDRCEVPRGAYPEDGKPYRDLWIASMKNDSTFGQPENLGTLINTKSNDGNAVIDPTGKVMYYTICGEGRFKKKWGCSIYESKYDAETASWGLFEKVPGIAGTQKVVINSKGKTKDVPTVDMHPTLADGGNTMYFASTREGGKGGMDIWVSSKAGTSWSTPVNAGSINTPGNEMSPHMGADGKKIYFASAGGFAGFGGYDLYEAEGSTSTWSAPKNLGAGINTSYDDFALIWTEQDSIGYLTSNRAGKGDDDIYRIVKQYCPPLSLTVQGLVRNENTKQVIPFATVTLFRYEKDGSLTPLDTMKTQQDGRYSMSIERGYRYKLVGTAPEYLSKDMTVDAREVKGKGAQRLEANIDILLPPIEIDMIVFLDNIYYDFDKADLRPESIRTLEKLVKLLKDNPSITIQINSHTDTNGSERYNVRLSNRRAKSVVTYLVEAGIDEKRLSSFGFGETRPFKYPELSDADEQANRRTEFRIRSMDFTPKAR